MITKGAFKAMVAAAGPIPRRLPRQLPPRAIEARYRKRMAPVLASMRAVVERNLTPEVLKDLAGEPSRLALDADKTGEIMDRIRAQFAEEWTRKEFERVVGKVPQAIEAYQADQLNKQLRAVVSVNVVGAEPWLQKAAEQFTAENVSLIKSIPSQFFDELERTLQKEIADGARFEELADAIETRYEISENRATLIARDQTGKFYGDLNRVRQKDLGVEAFFWRTVNDNRVRAEHEERNGQRYKWADPPDGETPGEPVQCRCYADPDLTDLIDS